MTRYDTRAQVTVRRARQRRNIAYGIVLLALGAYILGSFVYEVETSNPPQTSFGAVLGVFLLCLSLVPFSQAFVRRPHPEVIEVRDDALVLRFPGGTMRRMAWEDRPIDMAYDARKAPYGKKPYEGMEVQVYIPTEGRDPGVASLRPQEIDVSGAAFEEMKDRMAKAGFRAVARRWSRGRPGDLVEFLAEDEEEGPLPPEIRGGWGGRAHEVPRPPEDSKGS